MTLKQYFVQVFCKICSVFVFLMLFVRLFLLQYIWDSKTPDFSLEDFSSNKAKIKKGAMKGGATYNIELTASVIDKPSIQAKTSLQITTVSKPLVAAIARSPFFILGM